MTMLRKEGQFVNCPYKKMVERVVLAENYNIQDKGVFIRTGRDLPLRGGGKSGGGFRYPAVNGWAIKQAGIMP